MALGVAGLENIRLNKSKPQPPDDFDSADEFLAYTRKMFAYGMDYDRENREQALEDLRFFSGDQWDDAVRQARKDARKPTLTINRLPAFVQSFIANRRLNQTQVKIDPDNGGSKDVARLREELIRSIQKISKADRAYDNAFQNQVICGIGAFQIALDYAHDDVFEQDIIVERIVNPLSVVWDPMGTDLTGSDCRWCFVVDSMSKDAFHEMYPNATAGLPTNDMRLLGLELAEESLVINDEKVDVASFWRMRSEDRVVAMMSDGSVEDITDLPQENWLPRVMSNSDGEPYIRETRRRYAEMHLITATDILEGPYRLQIQRLPVIKATGWEVNVGDYRRRFGLVRFLRDPQMLHNYWRSIVAENLMRSPKAVWIAPDTAVEGCEDEFRKSHLTDDPLLVYNAESGVPPQLVPPPQMQESLITEASLSAQDIKDVSNIHEASLGMSSNEVSGKGILARQRVGEAGLVIYSDNLNDSICEGGQVINQLIPTAYDTPRVIKVLGEGDNSFRMVKINDANDMDSPDITIGKYEVTVTTGPSFTTKRVEAAEAMMNMINAMPETMSVAADKIVEAQDWPGADEIVRRLRTQLPPGIVSPDDLSEEQQAMMAQQAEAAQAAQQEDQADRVVKRALDQARAIEAQARARQAIAYAQKAMTEAELAPDVAWNEAEVAKMNSVVQSLLALTNMKQGNQQ